MPLRDPKTAFPPETSGLKTAHVLCVDIVGYSLLATDEQNRAVQQLQSIVGELKVFSEALDANDLICLPTGDGMALVCFGEPTVPVRIACDLAVKVRKECRFALRMGLNYGPVYCAPDINANKNVAGTGVNIAQRIMDCGDEGHILLSKSVADTLLELSYWRGMVQELGECEVKHGVRLRIYSLVAADFGNPVPPRRIQAGGVYGARVRGPGGPEGLALRAGERQHDAFRDPNTQWPATTPYRSTLSTGGRERRIDFILKGLMVTAAVVAGHHLLMALIGDPLRNFEYAILQNSLLHHYNERSREQNVDPDSSRLPVVIDISGYESTEQRVDQPTRIEKLNELALELADYSPKAIGIDVDFSPRDNGWPIRPNDWNIFARWMALTRPDGSRLPIKVGVFRRRYDAPPNWLGRPEFEPLAAGLLFPEDTQFNYYYIQDGTGENDRLLQLGAALHEAAGGQMPPGGPLFQIIHETTVHSRAHGLYAINYSYLSDIAENRVFAWRGPGSLASIAEQIRNSVVLIGDVRHSADSLPVARQMTRSVPGILIHACSLMTLKNEPLVFVDRGMSLTLDAAVALCGVLGIVYLPVLIRFERNADFHLARRRQRMSIAVILMVPLLLWVWRSRVFWPDVIFIAPVLFLDTFVSDPVWKILTTSGRTLRHLALGGKDND
jgi:class 3 adenylate cyclase